MVLTNDQIHLLDADDERTFELWGLFLWRGTGLD